MRDMDLDNFISNYSRPGWVEQGTAALEVRPDDDLMSVRVPTPALLLLYCFTAALLLLYCFTAALLLLYWHRRSRSPP
jgi:hypothetical protein